MVIWITGLSGSGKSTLCDALYRLIKPAVPQLVKLDGDEIRAAFGDDLGHAEADRHRQIRRIQGLSQVLARQGMVVMVAALYSHPDLLAWNRANLPGYFEIYVDAGLDLLAARDPKGLYANARRGEMPNVVGIDIPWHPPRTPDLTIDAAAAPPPDVLAQQVLRALPPPMIAPYLERT